MSDNDDDDEETRRQLIECRRKRGDSAIERLAREVQQQQQQDDSSFEWLQQSTRNKLSTGDPGLTVPSNEEEAEKMLVEINSLYADFDVETKGGKRLKADRFHDYYSGKELSSGDKRPVDKKQLHTADGSHLLRNQREVLRALLKECKTRFGEHGVRIVELLDWLSNEVSTLIVEFLYPRHSPNWCVHCEAENIYDHPVFDVDNPLFNRRAIVGPEKLTSSVDSNSFFDWWPYGLGLRALFIEGGEHLQNARTELLDYDRYRETGDGKDDGYGAVPLEQVKRMRKMGDSYTKGGKSRSVDGKGETEEQIRMRKDKKDQRRAVPVAGRLDYSVYTKYRELIESVDQEHKTTPLTPSQLTERLKVVIDEGNIVRGQRYLNQRARQRGVQEVIVNHQNDEVEGVKSDHRHPITVEEIMYQHLIEKRMRYAANKLTEVLSEVFATGESLFKDPVVYKVFRVLSVVATRETLVGQNGPMNWFCTIFKDVLAMSHNRNSPMHNAESSAQRHFSKTPEEVCTKIRMYFVSILTRRLQLYAIRRRNVYIESNMYPDALPPIRSMSLHTEDSNDSKVRDDFGEFCGVRRGDAGAAENVLYARKAATASAAVTLPRKSPLPLSKSPARSTTAATDSGAEEEGGDDYEPMCIENNDGDDDNEREGKMTHPPKFLMWTLIDDQDKDNEVLYHVYAPFHDSKNTPVMMERSASLVVRMMNHHCVPEEVDARITAQTSCVNMSVRVPLECESLHEDAMNGDIDRVLITDPKFDCLWRQCLWFLPCQWEDVECIKGQLNQLQEMVKEACNFYWKCTSLWQEFEPMYEAECSAIRRQEHSLYSENDVCEVAFGTAAQKMIQKLNSTIAQHNLETFKAIIGRPPDSWNWRVQARVSHIDHLKSINKVIEDLRSILPPGGRFYNFAPILESVVNTFCTFSYKTDCNLEQLEVDFKLYSKSINPPSKNNELHNLDWITTRILKYTSQRDDVNVAIATVASTGFVLGRNWANAATVSGFNMPVDTSSYLNIGMGYTSAMIAVCQFRDAIRFTQSAEEHDAFVSGNLPSDTAVMSILHSSSDDSDRRIDLRMDLLAFAATESPKGDSYNWTTMCMLGYIGRGVVSNNRKVMIDPSAVVIDFEHMPFDISQSGQTFFTPKPAESAQAVKFKYVYDQILDNVYTSYPSSAQWTFTEIRTEAQFETLLIYNQSVMASNGPKPGFFTFPGVRDRPDSRHLFELGESTLKTIRLTKQNWTRYQSVKLTIPRQTAKYMALQDFSSSSSATAITTTTTTIGTSAPAATPAPSTVSSKKSSRNGKRPIHYVRFQSDDDDDD